MKAEALAIVRAAIDAAVEELKKRGYEQEAMHAPRLFRDALKELEQTLTVTLITPTGDAGPLKKTVTDMLKKKLGKEVEVEEQADASIIGGAILQFGDERIDLSVRGSLQDLERQLTTQ